MPETQGQVRTGNAKVESRHGALKQEARANAEELQALHQFQHFGVGLHPSSRVLCPHFLELR